MTTISVTVVDEDADRLARQLRTELLGLDVDSVDLVPDMNVPAGAKTDLGTVTTIAVTLASSPVLVQAAGLLRDWVNRANGRKLVVKDGDRTIEITGYDLKDVAAFLNRENEGT